MGKEAVSTFGIEEEDTMRMGAATVAPLPLRQCIVLIFIGSAVCYGLGFAMVTAFNHILSVL